MANKVNTDSEVDELLGSEFQEDQAIDEKKLNISEETLMINRVSKVVKGGRRFSFTALQVAGDKNGHVGLGYGKANEVPDSIKKASEHARKNLIRVPLMGRTIPHAVIGRFGAARVMLKPAAEGTGLIAGSSVRLFLQLAGVHDILSKSLGSSNKLNVIKATMNGLKSLKRADHIAFLRGKNLDILIGSKGAEIYKKSKTSILAAEQPEVAKRQAEEKKKAENRMKQEAEKAQLEETVPSEGTVEQQSPAPIGDLSAGSAPSAPPEPEQTV